MSLDYEAKASSVPPFYANSCSADLLAHIHQAVGAGLSPGTRLTFDIRPRVPYHATASECRAWAQLLADASAETLLPILATPTGQECWDEGPEAFVTWVREWQDFLFRCEGYDAR